MLCSVATDKVAAARRVLNGEGPKKVKAKSPTATKSPTVATAPTTASTEDPTSDSGATPKYRDRTQERRRVHNQPEVPILPSARGGKPSFPVDAASFSLLASEPPAAKSEPPVDVGKDENNVGNKLLKKMGWSEGSGLGADGEGRSEPVKAAVYASGAGLGASKGREVTSLTSTTYGDAAKESARERYEG